MKRISAAGLVALTLVPLSLVAQAAPLQEDVPVLSPGDLVQLTVWRKPELSGEFAIAADSTISHPLLRSVKVAGVPLVVVEDRLRGFLADFEAQPQFVLRPLFRVGIGGEVRQPNLYTFSPEVTIAQAVALAGGATDRGRLNRVRLLRGGREYMVDLTRPDEGLSRAPVRSGDQLVVERRRSLFQDYIAPAASVTAALGTILNLILR